LAVLTSGPLGQNGEVYAYRGRDAGSPDEANLGGRDQALSSDSRADEVAEVKMLTWLYHKDPEKAALAKRRLDAMEAACTKLGFSFTLLTEDEIRVEPRLYNAKMVQRHCGPLVPQSSIVVALSALAAAPDTITIREFSNMIAPLHPIYGLGLAVKLERLGHVRIDRREKYSFSHND
jgi:hypothetical protein